MHLGQVATTALGPQFLGVSPCEIIIPPLSNSYMWNVHIYIYIDMQTYIQILLKSIKYIYILNRCFLRVQTWYVSSGLHTHIYLYAGNTFFSRKLRSGKLWQCVLLALMPRCMLTVVLCVPGTSHSGALGHAGGASWCARWGGSWRIALWQSLCYRH